MSKLAELLVSRGALPTPANPANPANPHPQISNFSNFSGGSPGGLNFSHALEHRIRAMARRWEYSQAELSDALRRARHDPGGWGNVVAIDEQREAEFRACGILPRADA